MKRLVLVLGVAAIAAGCGSTNEGTTNLPTTTTPVAPPVAALEESQLSVNDFVTQLKAINLSQSDDLAGARDRWVDWYSRARIDRSVPRNGYVVDCVPYDQQPGLLNASAEDRNAALTHRVQPSNLDFSQHDFDSSTLCPTGDVPVIRPRLDHFRNLNRRAHFKDYKRRNTRFAGKGDATVQYSDAGYAYIDSPDNTIDATHNQIFVALFGGTTQATVPSGGDHFLEQEWWVTTGDNIASLESGIITSNYWSNNTNKTIFIFSTPNSYSSKGAVANAANQYNLAGGFIQNPNTPTFGTPVGAIDYVFNYVKNSVGYEMYLTPITLDSNGVASLGTTIDMGYWPQSHYAGFPGFSANPSFRVLQSGFEVYGGSGNPPVVGKATDGTIQIYGSQVAGTVNTGASFLPINASTFTNSDPSKSSATPVFGTQPTTMFGTVNTVSFSGSN